MEDFVRKGNLYELYGGLLKENPRRVYEYHVVDDMSFSVDQPAGGTGAFSKGGQEAAVL